AVLLVAHVERMAADPRLPAPVRRPSHDRILHADRLVAREPGAWLGALEVGGVISLEQVDPPVAARRLARRAHVEAPAAFVGPDHAWTLHRGGIEPGLVEPGDRREPLAVRGTCDDGRPAPGVPGPHPVGDDE